MDIRMTEVLLVADLYLDWGLESAINVITGSYDIHFDVIKRVDRGNSRLVVEEVKDKIKNNNIACILIRDIYSDYNGRKSREVLYVARLFKERLFGESVSGINMPPMFACANYPSVFSDCSEEDYKRVGIIGVISGVGAKYNHSAEENAQALIGGLKAYGYDIPKRS